ncbi:MAG: glycosyltransferase [Duncaniella sp.]|nr:glycosyltransferase [Duncaniella sp.]
MSQPKVSVIVPVYKVEQYIEECARSLFEQTLEDIEYIFVDDCSPDKSIDVLIDVLNDYPHRAGQVKILRHTENGGVSRSRQDGVDASTGEYVIHCDPDDWVDKDMYKLMYEKAVAADADIVGCDYALEYPDKSEVKRQNFDLVKDDAVEAIFSGKLHAGLWCRLIRRDLIEKAGVKFRDDVVFMEDMLYVVPLHDVAEKVAYVDKAMYHYRMRGGSATQRMTERNLNSVIAVLDELKKYSRTNAAEHARKCALATKTLGLITQPETYNPDLWRSITKGIHINAFGSRKHRLSPFLVRSGLDALNYGIIKLYRSLGR